MIQIFPDGFVKVYNKNGISVGGYTKSHFDYCLDQKYIDNLDYIEAVDVLNNLKEKQNA